MGKMDGKVALITGGASGLGAEDARVLAREGAKVVITDMQVDLGEQVAAEIPDCLFLQHDVRDEARWAEVVAQTISRFGRLDTLVNNAGLVRFGTVEDLAYDDFRLQMDVMVNGAFLGCKAAIPHMSRDGSGSIINMASVAALKGISTIPAYSAAKAGVIGMTRSIAVHCREQAYKIRCNAIAPGGIVTPMTAQALAQLPQDAAGLDQIQNHGMGQPSDIANMVLYLACDDGRHITGTTITIDNGETMA
ncbi:SDR family oxidoreductase [Novosphingobium sp. SL115]|uniref:SDR family oxidoreductase n=1 Tax=Novosphingobium sp. SL115 TaxID=2995150 RepID=UPI0022764E4C|nr:SDR family oxidoreductase [Novosphingobium sp. SL115]MCY1672705.1 SDR family oxidoreductase [Novosphingobium sp. SL115]